MPEVRLIDANALKKKHCDCCVASADCMGSGCKIYEARCLIAELPTIEPEVRRGRWIQRRNGKYYCTNCGREERFIFQKNYCPRCGSDMREVSEDARTAK